MAKQRKIRKKNNEKKARELLKLQLHMTAPEGLDNEDRALAGEAEIFDLGEGEREAARRGKRKGLGDTMVDVDGMSDEEEEEEEEEEESDEEVLDSDEERERRLGALEGELDGLYDEYKERKNERDAKFRVKEARAKDKNYDSWHGIREGEEDDGVETTYRNGGVKIIPRRGDADEEEEEESDEGGWDVIAANKARLGEEPDSSDEDDDVERPTKIARKENSRVTSNGHATARPPPKTLVTSLREKEERAQMSRQAQVWFDQSVFKDAGDLAALDGDDEESEEENVEDEDEEEEDEDEDMEASSDEDDKTLEGDDEDVDMDDEDDFEIVPQTKDDGPSWDVDDEDQDEVKKQIIKGEWIGSSAKCFAKHPDKGLLTAEAVTLATQLVNRQTTADKLIDDGFNRLSTFNKDGLPAWFLDDESKYYKPNIPITKEAMAALRDRQRALDARPIKKVAEAKARKKFKAHQRLEKARKKADGVMEAEDLDDASKARQVGKVLGKAFGKEQKKDKKIVVARGANKGVQGRPRGVKGKYKIVDARMRKETRALKRVKKAAKKKRS